MDGIYAVMDFLLPFDWAEYNFMKNALLAVLMLTPLLGLTGTMIVNNKLSFFSDALGHSALTGIGIGVLLGVDNYMLSMIGFALLFALCITGIIQSETASSDTIIGVFSAVGVALGVVLLSANGGFTKYSNYLIGDILAISQSELLLLAIVLVAAVVMWTIIFNKLLLASVNADLASSKRVRVRLYNNLFVIMIALLVTISIKGWNYDYKFSIGTSSRSRQKCIFFNAFISHHISCILDGFGSFRIDFIILFWNFSRWNNSIICGNNLLYNFLYRKKKESLKSVRDRTGQDANRSTSLARG